MKIVWVAVAGLVLGTGAGTGWGAVRVKNELLTAKAAEKVKAGRHANTDAPTAGSQGAEVPADTAHAPTDTAHAGDSAAMARAAPSAAPHSAAAGGPGEAAGPADPAAGMIEVQAVSGEGARRLGMIFAAMKAADAASVLGRMTDAEAAAVLLQMSDRQAAPILGSLPPDRAAVVGRLVLAGRGGAP